MALSNAVRGRGIPAALVALAWLLPLLAIVGTSVALTLSGSSGRLNAIVYGSVLAVLVWLLAGMVYSPMTSVESANRSSYGDATNRLDALSLRLANVSSYAPANDRQGVDDANKHIEFIQGHLFRNQHERLKWVTGNGYITLWQRVHRAEEALVASEGPHDLFEEIIHFEYRLKGSGLPQLEALEHLLGEVRAYLNGGHSGRHGINSIPEARKVLLQVRFAFNDFRDTKWNGLLQLRNQTMTALLLTEITVLVLLILIVLAGAPLAALAIGSIYFVVGATVGVFSRLFAMTHADAAIEDYGLSLARLVALPIYSGLAGIGGLLISTVSATQTSPATALANVFDQVNPFAVVLAAGFALAPGLVLSRLGEISEQYKKDLKGTQPS